jgi:vacuolar-type H+-ATPase subunit H
MEKLERILSVEERARDIVAEAREHAASLERAAASDADHIRRSTVAAARTDAKAKASAILEEAHSRRERFDADAAASRDAYISAAESRLPAAVAAVLDELAG